MARKNFTFFNETSGAAKVEAVFAVLALTAVALVAVYLVMSGPEEEIAPPRDPVEIAMTELLGGQIRQFSPMQARARLNIYLDPSQRTNTQLRNAHRTWTARNADRFYSDPDLANDMAAILDHAMRIRGVRPDAGS